METLEIVRREEGR